MKFFAFILLCSTLLCANTPAAKITSLTGEARIFTKGEIAPKNAALNGTLKVKQTLKTRLNSEAGITFKDSTKVLVGPNSSLEVLDIKKLSVEGEKVLFKITKQSDLKGLVITTPTAIIGVKGTMFMINSDGKNQTIYLKEGEIEVKSPQGLFKNYLTSIEDEFNAYKADMEKEFAVYVEEFTMKGMTAISISGNEVHAKPYTKEIDAEFEAFKRF